VGWLINWKAFRRKWSWPNLRTTSTFSWMDWGKPRETCQSLGHCTSWIYAYSDKATHNLFG
jgi:hypothetical protein